MVYYHTFEISLKECEMHLKQILNIIETTKINHEKVI